MLIAPMHAPQPSTKPKPAAVWPLWAIALLAGLALTEKSQRRAANRRH